MEMTAPLRPDVIRMEILPALGRAVRVMTEPETGTMAAIHDITDQMTPDGLTTAGAVIDNILYPYNDAPTHKSQTVALNRLRKKINALFDKAGLNVTCHLSKENALGKTRPLSFRQTGQDLYRLQPHPTGPSPLSGDVVLRALETAFNKRPSTGRGARRILRLAYAVVTLSSKKGYTTSGDLLSALCPSVGQNRRRATDSIGHWRRALNAFLQKTGVPIELSVDTQRNAGAHRKFYFTSVVPHAQEPTMPSLPLPQTKQEMDTAFLQFLSRYAK